jgi:hypothetical protein
VDTPSTPLPVATNTATPAMESCRLTVALITGHTLRPPRVSATNMVDVLPPDATPARSAPQTTVVALTSDLLEIAFATLHLVIMDSEEDLHTSTQSEVHMTILLDTEGLERYDFLLRTKFLIWTLIGYDVWSRGNVRVL